MDKKLIVFHWTWFWFILSIGYRLNQAHSNLVTEIKLQLLVLNKLDAICGTYLERLSHLNDGFIWFSFKFSLLLMPFLQNQWKFEFYWEVVRSLIEIRIKWLTHLMRKSYKVLAKEFVFLSIDSEIEWLSLSVCLAMSWVPALVLAPSGSSSLATAVSPTHSLLSTNRWVPRFRVRRLYIQCFSLT